MIIKKDENTNKGAINVESLIVKDKVENIEIKTKYFFNFI